MPKTAKKHFDEDLSRARSLIGLATTLDIDSLVANDLLRSAWMFAVGSLDAYFCDAYADLIAVTLICKSRQPTIVLPDFFLEIKLPVWTIIEDYDRQNWKWRMAARELIERENVLSLGTIQTLFNKFFAVGNRFFGDVLDLWMQDSDAEKRLFGCSSVEYLLKTPSDRQAAQKNAKLILSDRFGSIFQRRHDCIHNCDRPRLKPQPLKSPGTVNKVIDDIEFLVTKCDQHIDREFRSFLMSLNCSSSTINLTGY